MRRAHVTQKYPPRLPHPLFNLPISPNKCVFRCTSVGILISPALKEMDMEIARLAEYCRRYATDSNNELQSLPYFSVLYEDSKSSFEAVVYQPVICLILQGSKETSIGDQFVELQAGDALLVSHDLPVVSAITKASAQEPYIAAILSLDLRLVRSLYEQVGEALTPVRHTRSLSAGPADPTWLEPLGRYIALMDNPLDTQVLGKSILREIHYRLLLSPIGGMLRNLLSVDSHASRVAKAILRIRADFRSPMTVADLARTAGMGLSSFHDHFRLVTGTTPLQYQKDLRLIEARALIMNGHHSVSTAAFTVGYESTSHFSRDYSRKFGAPPSRDVDAVVPGARNLQPATA
jgi:AraC-like DNA-binding protein